MALCSVAGAGLQGAHRCIRASAGQRCSTAALRAPLVGGRAAVADRRRRLVLPRAQQQEDPALALLEAEDLSQNERIAAGKAVAAATNRWDGGRWLRCRSNGACWLHAHRPLEGLCEAGMQRLSCCPCSRRWHCMQCQCAAQSLTAAAYCLPTLPPHCCSRVPLPGYAAASSSPFGGGRSRAMQSAPTPSFLASLQQG